MITVDIAQAGSSLPAIIEKAFAGEEVYITRPDHTSVRLVPQQSVKKLPLLGLMEGQFTIPDDWKEWPEEEARALGIID